MKFDDLALSIVRTHESLQASAVSTINSLISIRNWIIGFFIVEFEQSGEDRAAYGDRIITQLAKEF